MNALPPQQNAAIVSPAPEATAESIEIEDPYSHRKTSWDQLVTFEAAPFTPASVAVSNGSYRFDYGALPSTYAAQLGWGVKLLNWAGSFYAEATLSFSTLSGAAVQGAGSDLSTTSYGMGMLGADARLMYAADWLPVRWLIPFVDGGYRYTAYYQPGGSGLDSADGGVGNPVASAGLRFWLNPKGATTGSGGHPWYLTGKVERIFPAVNDLNLASTSGFGGLSVGF